MEDGALVGGRVGPGTHQGKANCLGSSGEGGQVWIGLKYAHISHTVHALTWSHGPTSEFLLRPVRLSAGGALGCRAGGEPTSLQFCFDSVCVFVCVCVCMNGQPSLGNLKVMESEPCVERGKINASCRATV